MLDTPMCSRHDNDADNVDERVRATYCYVLGLLGGIGAAKETIASIVRLHDHKGDLYVVTAKSIGAKAMAAFREAWKEIAYEIPEHVHFVSATSQDWLAVWGSRRFESDWKH